MWKITRWFTISWWRYLCAKPAHGISLWTAFFCRVGGHKCGPIYFNPMGYEPDDRCKNCNDYI